MDPLSALGVATSVVQFIDFSSKILVGAVKIHRSGDQHKTLELITEDLAELTAPLELDQPDSSSTLLSTGRSANDRRIHDLCRECHLIAIQLRDALKGLKARKGTKWESFQKALSSMWNEDKINNLRKQLEDYREELIILILVALRESVAKVGYVADQTKSLGQQFLKNLSESEKWQADLLAAVTASYHREAPVAGHTPQEKLSTESYSGIAAGTFARRFLRSLQYREMSDRIERIPVRYKQTYDWIFRTDVDSAVPWMSFIEWLSNDTGTYWITGKPGAGKSTLMKFIYQDPRTFEILYSSLRGKKRAEIIVAGFFFWNSGGPIQMSGNGMIQTLLHRCLKDSPDLVPLVVPGLWEAYYFFGEVAIEGLSWSWDELSRMFNALFENGGSKNFLLLVDGLDEFSGNHAELINLLQSKAHLRNVKMCVASRPWPIFEDAFQQAASLRIEDLTYPDIIHYTSQKLQGNPGFKSFQEENPEYTSDLVEHVAQKSSGVFLWVALVVSLLLEGLTNGDRISDLKKRIDELPPDLEDFFEKILNSIESRYATQASQLFQLVHVATEPLTLLELSYADEEDFHIVFDHPPERRDRARWELRAERTKRRMYSRCKGLLEVAAASDSKLCYSTVQYLHRTVKDFMEKPHVQARITASMSQTFDPYISLAIARLMALKLGFLISWASAQTCIKYADMSAKAFKTDLAVTVKVMDQLQDVMNHHKVPFPSVKPNAPTAEASYTGERRTRGSLLLDTSSGSGYRLPCPDNFLNFAVRRQIHWYINKKLENGLPSLSSWQRAHPPLLCAVRDWHYMMPAAPQSSFTRPNLLVIQALLKAGTDPNQVTEAENGASPWQIVVREVTIPEESISFSRYKEWLEWAKIARLFLDHGAETKTKWAKEAILLLNSAGDGVPKANQKWLAAYHKAQRRGNHDRAQDLTEGLKKEHTFSSRMTWFFKRTFG